MKQRQDIVNNLEKILSGELEIIFVPALREHIKNKNLIEYKCNKCGLDEWLKNEITLELDHIDGNKRNNSRSNLRWLCPNCHSQTINWKVKNHNKEKDLKTKKWISDDDFIKSINKGGTISEMLKRLGLRVGGSNYDRIYNIIKIYNLKLG